MNEHVQNLNQAILKAMDTFAGKPCFKVKQGKRYRDISYRYFQILTFRAIKFLRSQGISNGERVAIVANNSLEWMVIYIATLLSGGVVVPLRPEIAPNTLRFTLQDSDACLVALDDPQLVETVLAFTDEADNQLPNLTAILTINEVEAPSPGSISMTSVLADTPPLTAEERNAIQIYAAGTAPETLTSIHYTAGETGRLKGAVFDHARALKSIHHLATWLTFNEDDLAFTVMSWGYAASLQAALHYWLSGVANVISESDDKLIAENMRQASPTVSLNMPYFFQRFYEHVMADFARQPESTRQVFKWALAKGREYWAAGSTASPELRQEYTRADLTFFNQIRGYVGGRLRRLYSAGAPLPQELAEFFQAIGLPVLNLYSITEAGGFPFISRPDAYRPDSCGRLAPGFEARIATDGEVLVRGETVMSEYWGWPSEMQQVLDADDWLHSGDLGSIDEDGYLYLTGRKQPMMMLTTGRKVMPVAIENALMDSPFIAHATVFGDGRPFVTALIVPDLEALAGHFQEDEETGDEQAGPIAPETSIKWLWRQENDAGEMMITTAHPKVQVLLDKTIGEVNSRLNPREQIRQYCLLEQASSKAANDLVDALALGRHVVIERYCSAVEAMYPRLPHVKESAVTQVRVSPERLRELLEKESILDAWLADAGIQFLFDLARNKQIDAPSMVHISDAAATIAQMESEEKPLSTALIVGDPVRIARVLPESQVQLLRHDHIRRMRSMLVTLAKMVDGLVLGYVVDRYGYVRGIHKLDVALDEQPVSFLLGPQFRHHAAISRQCNAVVFFVPTGGRQVRVFAGGKLVGRYSNGDWSPESILQVDEVVAQLVEQKNYSLALVQRVLRCAFQMSEENLGAIFVIGNADTILAYSDAPETSYFAMIVSDELDHLSDRELINFARQDGATVIDVQGKFRGCMVLLRPDASTQAEIGAGKGARHSSAAKMSAEANCLAITVSQDGPITIYESGRRVLSL